MRRKWKRQGSLVAAWLGLGLILGLANPAPPPSAHAPEALVEVSAWEYRAVAADGDAGPWTPNLAEAVEALGDIPATLPWPRVWVTFAPWDFAPPRNGDDHPASFEAVPELIHLRGHSAGRATLTVDRRGALDFTWLQGEPRPRRPGHAFARVTVPETMDIGIEAFADGDMAWWVNQEPVFRTPEGARPGAVHRFPARLREGDNVLAVVVESGANDWTMTSRGVRVLDPPHPGRLEARAEFQAGDPSAWRSLTFQGPEPERVRLNSKPLPLPLPGMVYDAVPGIPTDLLREGRNELTRSWAADEVSAMVAAATTDRRATPVRNEGRLLGLGATAVHIQTGPHIARATETSLRIQCRTNAVVPAVLRIDGREMRSAPGLRHVFKVDGLDPATGYPYELAPDIRGAADEAIVRATARTLPAEGPVTLGFCGDPQSGREVWERAARRFQDGNPDLVVIAGDLVVAGREDAQWDDDLFGPAADLFASVPVYGAMGNHDHRAPVFDWAFTDPHPDRLGRNWVQRVGPALVVGINYNDHWGPGSAAATWLDRVLDRSEDPYVFVVSHVSPFSSSWPHGRMLEDGRVAATAGRIARELILPILERHRVTAWFCGHDHNYERSEPPGGVTVIITAGAGARLYGPSQDPDQNPHSEVYVHRHHVSFVRADAEQAVFTAVDLDGEVLDPRAWAPRQRGPWPR